MGPTMSAPFRVTPWQGCGASESAEVELGDQRLDDLDDVDDGAEGVDGTHVSVLRVVCTGLYVQGCVCVVFLYDLVSQTQVSKLDACFGRNDHFALKLLKSSRIVQEWKQ